MVAAARVRRHGSGWQCDPRVLQLLNALDLTTRRLIAAGAIAAPLLHSITDLMEWLQGGFSPLQLWLNYAAFLPLPAILLGLYAVQRPAIARYGLAGALVYGFAFIYFTSTTLVALTQHVPDYDALWNQLGRTYTVHGAMMILGGGLFGSASFRAGVLPKWASALFLAGLAMNLVLTFVPVPDLYQTLGTTLRNAGLIGMGLAILRSRDGIEH